jgi:hypothetical protein
MRPASEATSRAGHIRITLVEPVEIDALPTPTQFPTASPAAELQHELRTIYGDNWHGHQAFRIAFGGKS